MDKQNWRANVALLFTDLHTYIKIESQEHAKELLRFFDWLHPYSCKSSVERHMHCVQHELTKHDAVYFHILGSNYHNGIGRVTTMNLSIGSHAPTSDIDAILSWNDLRYPLYCENERNDDLLSEDLKAFLKSLR